MDEHKIKSIMTFLQAREGCTSNYSIQPSAETPGVSYLQRDLDETPLVRIEDNQEDTFYESVNQTVIPNDSLRNLLR